MIKKVVVVVPVYNEANNLKILLPLIFSGIEKVKIFVVDDNSNDGTSLIIKKIKLKYKNLYHLKRGSKMGRGTAVTHGFRYAYKNTNAKVFVEMDADLSHDPSELKKLISLVDVKKVGIASRYLSKSEIIGSPFIRRLLSKLANYFNSVLFGLPIHDNTNGYRAYPREAVKLLIKHKYKSTGFVTISESSYFLFKNGYTLKEMPTKFVNRRIGGSKANAHEVYISIRDLLRIRFTS